MRQQPTPGSGRFQELAKSRPRFNTSALDRPCRSRRLRARPRSRARRGGHHYRGGGGYGGGGYGGGGYGGGGYALAQRRLLVSVGVLLRRLGRPRHHPTASYRSSACYDPCYRSSVSSWVIAEPDVQQASTGPRPAALLPAAPCTPRPCPWLSSTAARDHHAGGHAHHRSVAAHHRLHRRPRRRRSSHNPSATPPRPPRPRRSWSRRSPRACRTTDGYAATTTAAPRSRRSSGRLSRPPPSRPPPATPSPAIWPRPPTARATPSPSRSRARTPRRASTSTLCAPRRPRYLALAGTLRNSAPTARAVTVPSPFTVNAAVKAYKSVNTISLRVGDQPLPGADHRSHADLRERAHSGMLKSS